MKPLRDLPSPCDPLPDPCAPPGAAFAPRARSLAQRIAAARRELGEANAGLVEAAWGYLGLVGAEAGGDAARARELLALPAPAASPVEVAAALTGLTGRRGAPGQALLRWKRLPGALLYVVEGSDCAEDPEPAWRTLATGPKERLDVVGLESGCRYWFRVAAFLSGGQSASCAPVAMTAR
jgi:hypothetical protein